MQGCINTSKEPMWEAEYRRKQVVIGVSQMANGQVLNGQESDVAQTWAERLVR